MDTACAKDPGSSDHTSFSPGHACREVLPIHQCNAIRETPMPPRTHIIHVNSDIQIALIVGCALGYCLRQTVIESQERSSGLDFRDFTRIRMLSSLTPRSSASEIPRNFASHTAKSMTKSCIFALSFLRLWVLESIGSIAKSNCDHDWHGV